MSDTFISGALWHSLHITSPGVSVCVLWQAYNLVGSNCSQSSSIPPTVCVRDCFHPLSHQKHPSKLKLISSLLIQLRFPFQLFSWNASHVFCSKPDLSSAFKFLCCYRLFTIMLYAGWVWVLKLQLETHLLCIPCCLFRSVSFILHLQFSICCSIRRLVFATHL